MTDHTDGAPPGRSVVAPFISVKNADCVLDFAQAVFGATLARPPLRRSDGRLWNAELALGGATIFVAEATSDDMHRPVFVHVYVPDAQAAYARALDAGAQSIMAPEDHFYGDHAGGVADACGNWWWIATHKEDVSDDELARRAVAEEARRPAPQR